MARKAKATVPARGPVKKKSGAKKRVLVGSVNVPGYTRRVDGEMYGAMKRALMKVLPAKKPGLTQFEMFRAVVPHLPGTLFPAGAKAGWWAKTVQLDLEAKGVVVRETTKPLRWHLRSRRDG